MAVRENPDSHIAYFNSALSRMALNRLKEAEEDLKQTLVLNPEFNPAIIITRNIQKQLNETGGDTYTVQAGAFFIGAE